MGYVPYISYSVADKNPRNTYEISVTYMHGDADAYSTGIARYTGHEKAKLGFEYGVLLAWVNLNHNHKCDMLDSYKRRVDWLYSVGVTQESVDEISDKFFSEGDYTIRDGTIAMIESVKVFYYDPDGVKFNVNMLNEQN